MKITKKQTFRLPVGSIVKDDSGAELTKREPGAWYCSDCGINHTEDEFVEANGIKAFEVVQLGEYGAGDRIKPRDAFVTGLLPDGSVLRDADFDYESENKHLWEKIEGSWCYGKTHEDRMTRYEERTDHDSKFSQLLEVWGPFIVEAPEPEPEVEVEVEDKPVEFSAATASAAKWVVFNDHDGDIWSYNSGAERWEMAWQDGCSSEIFELELSEMYEPYTVSSKDVQDKIIEAHQAEEVEEPEEAEEPEELSLMERLVVAVESIAESLKEK